MQPTTSAPATVDGYEALPEGAPYQLIHGQLIFHAELDDVFPWER